MASRLVFAAAVSCKLHNVACETITRSILKVYTDHSPAQTPINWTLSTSCPVYTCLGVLPAGGSSPTSARHCTRAICRGHRTQGEHIATWWLGCKRRCSKWWGSTKCRSSSGSVLLTYNTPTPTSLTQSTLQSGNNISNKGRVIDRDTEVTNEGWVSDHNTGYNEGWVSDHDTGYKWRMSKWPRHRLQWRMSKWPRHRLQWRMSKWPRHRGYKWRMSKWPRHRLQMKDE